jgi:hypothetical protein
MTGRCVTCRYWKRCTDEFTGPYAGTCSCEKFIYEAGDKLPKDALTYWDYESYAAGFETGENFGCVHWMKAENLP